MKLFNRFKNLELLLCLASPSSPITGFRAFGERKRGGASDLLVFWDEAGVDSRSGTTIFFLVDEK